MKEEFFVPDFVLERTRQRHKPAGAWAQRLIRDGFKCAHCHTYVSAEPALSGVLSRNHCPYCLWSRHLDLYAAGDRLSACKGSMRPLGLALKQTRKKYGPQQGELLLVHACVECGKVSANRIAADDLADRLYAVFESSATSEAASSLLASGVALLGPADVKIVKARLFGRE